MNKSYIYAKFEFMKKNVFKFFMEKLLSLPLDVRIATYYRLKKDIEDKCSVKFLNRKPDEIFSQYVPLLTYDGKVELTECKCGLDINIYNFLKMALNNYSILEIAINSYFTMEECAKYFLFCVEQEYIKKPASAEIMAMAGFLSGKLKTGEYLKHSKTITTDQWLEALKEQKKVDSYGKHLKFVEILETLGFATEDDIKPLVSLHIDAKKRFILDYNIVPEVSEKIVDEDAKQSAEFEELKKENALLKEKLLQLLKIVKKNA